MLRRHLLLVLLAFLAGSVSLAAQTISVRTMAMTPAEMPELYLKTEGRQPLTLVEWPSRQPSVAMAAMSPGDLTLYHRELSENGEETLAAAHRVPLPTGAREILLLGWINEGGIRFRALEDVFLNAKFNDWLLVNFSSKEIAFRIGDKSPPVRLKGGHSRIYRIDARKNKGATVLGRAEIRGEIRTFYSTYLPVADKRRTIMFFVDDGDKIRTKRVIDHFRRRDKPAETTNRSLEN